MIFHPLVRQDSDGTINKCYNGKIWKIYPKTSKYYIGYMYDCPHCPNTDCYKQIPKIQSKL